MCRQPALSTRIRSVRHGRIARCGLLAVLLAGTLPADAACPMPLPELPVRVAGHLLTAELAVTPQAQACGLAGRDTLDAGRAMLFVFDRPVRIAFWMKDTRVPLSIAFLDAQGRILALDDMAAGDAVTRHRPPVPYRYAIETQLGWFARRGIGVGERVRFDLSAAR